MTDENANRSTHESIDTHSTSVKPSHRYRNLSLRWLIDGSLVVGLGVLGALAIEWGLSRPPQANRQTQGAQQITQNSPPGSRTGPLSSSPHPERLSPFKLNRFVSAADLASASRGCKLVQTEHANKSGGIRSYRVAGDHECELKASQITFLVSQAWFDSAGLRSILMHPRDTKATERFWLEIKQQAQPSEGVGDVYCWADACARRSNGVFGVWRRLANNHSS